MKRKLWTVGFIIMGLLTLACGVLAIIEKKSGSIDGIPAITFLGGSAQLYGGLLILIGLLLTVLGCVFVYHLPKIDSLEKQQGGKGAS